MTDNPAQGDMDGDGLGDRCDTDTRCGHGMELQPLLAPVVTVESGIDEICLLCSISDEMSAIDEDLRSAATLLVPVGVTGGVFLRVLDASATHPAGTTVGFVVEAPGLALADLFIVGSHLRLVTRLDGEVQEIDNAPEILDATADGISLRGLAVLETTAPFDAVEIQLGTGIGVLDALRVDTVCATMP